MLASPLCSTIESELLSLVCFSKPPEEDNALFSVIVLEVTRANEVEKLKQEATLQEEEDRPHVGKSGGAMRVQKLGV
jgi:hypothetical protein